MDSIRIDAGIVRLAINEDENRVIEFNPTDILFVEKFYATARNFESKLEEHEKRGNALFNDNTADDNGVPLNVEERAAFLREFLEYWRDQIDELFGEGTSQIAFQGVLSAGMFRQFFDGITPYFQNAREDKTAPYRPPRSRSKSKKAMK